MHHFLGAFMSLALQLSVVEDDPDFRALSALLDCSGITTRQ